MLFVFLSVCCDILVFPSLLYQVTIMAQRGFALFKQIAAAHLGNAAVQVQLCWAVRNLAANADNQVRRFLVFVLYTFLYPCCYPTCTHVVVINIVCFFFC